MKKIITLIVILLILFSAVGGVAYLSKDFEVLDPAKWDIFDKKAEVTETADVLSFADNWELTAGTGETAFKINQNTKSIIIDDLSVDGAGGAFSDFKCNDNTFAEKIAINITVNNTVWNATSKYSRMEVHGDIIARTFDYHGYGLTQNCFTEYYNQNKNDITVKSGDCLATMTVEISFAFPEKIEIMKKLGETNAPPLDYLTFKDRYLYFANIPIIKA